MEKYLDYAMGHNRSNRMPLFVKPVEKLSTKEVMWLMRDHYEDTPLDMRNDIGAGGHNLPYRWRPMTFTVDGQSTSTNVRSPRSRRASGSFPKAEAGCPTRSEDCCGSESTTRAHRA